MTNSRWQFSALAVLVVRVGGQALWYLALVLTTRWGTARAGASFATFAAWASIVAVPMYRGWPQLALRFGAARADEVAQLWWQSTASMIRRWLPVAVVGLALSPIGPEVGLLGVGGVLLAILRIDEGWLRATRSAVQSAFGISFAVPVVLIIAVAAVDYFTMVTPWTVVLVMVGAWLVVASAQRFAVGIRAPQTQVAVADDLSSTLWTITVSTATGVLTRNADIAVAALVLSPTEVASYALISRLSQGLLQIGAASNAVVAPSVAEDWYEDRRGRAHARVAEAGMYAGGFAAVCSLVLFAIVPVSFRLSQLPLNTEHWIALATLIAGNLVTTGVGPGMLGLNITGGERLTAQVQVVTLVGLVLALGVAALVGSLIAFAAATALTMACSHTAHRIRWARRALTPSN